VTAIQQIVAIAARHPYAVLLLGIFAENAGLPIPGEVLIVAIAAAAATTHASLPLIAAAAALGAILGDNFSYWIGRRGGHFLIGCYCRATLSAANCGDRIVGLYTRLGPGAVSVARFLPAVRALVAPMAGMTRMKWARFAMLDALGAALWATVFTLGGALIGDSLAPLIDRFHAYGHWVIVAFLAAAVGRLAYRLFQRAKYGAASEASLREVASEHPPD
jgi:membrane protein DedA with SNARE-associated domain